MNILKVFSRKWYKSGYEVRKELWQINEENPMEMLSAYNHKGQYIGRPKDARFLSIKLGIRIFETVRDSKICTVGFNPLSQIWYGWSHRASVGFRIGDMLFEEDFGDDKTPFNRHGNVKIETLEQARQAAANFAEYVS